MNWISVKERLPDEQIPVYVYYNGIVATKVYHRGVFYSGEIHRSVALGKVENVSHWMYIPERIDK